MVADGNQCRLSNTTKNRTMLKLSKLFLTGIATGALGLLLSIPAQAVVILPGANQPATGEPLDAQTGTLVASQAQAFAGGGANGFTGTLFSAVLDGDLSNPYGGLTFVLQVANNGTSASALGRLTIEGFEGFLVDASFSNLASATLEGALFTDGGIPPFLFDRSLNGDVIGAGFTFTKLTPGTRSSLLIFQTNATNFELNSVNIINGSVAVTVGLSPAASTSVPDGGSALALLGLAMVGVEGLRRKLRLA